MKYFSFFIFQDSHSSLTAFNFTAFNSNTFASVIDYNLERHRNQISSLILSFLLLKITKVIDVFQRGVIKCQVRVGLRTFRSSSFKDMINKLFSFVFIIHKFCVFHRSKWYQLDLEVEFLFGLFTNRSSTFCVFYFI